MPSNDALGRHPAFGKRNPSNRGMPLDPRPLRSLDEARAAAAARNADLSPKQREALGRLGVDPCILAVLTKG